MFFCTSLRTILLVAMLLLQVLGHIGYHIIAAGLNGYMATVNNLKNPVNKWRCGAAPITVQSLTLLKIAPNAILHIVKILRKFQSHFSGYDDREAVWATSPLSRNS